MERLDHDLAQGAELALGDLNKLTTEETRQVAMFSFQQAAEIAYEALSVAQFMAKLCGVSQDDLDALADRMDAEIADEQ